MTGGLDQGFDKYSSKMEAVQVMLINSGAALADINALLDDLQFYTDETSYSFSQMVSAMGKFTAANVDIEVAEEMVEGLCRVSGSDVGIAVTGFAGSAGNKVNDGVYYFAIKIKDYIYLERHQVYGPRNECRASQTRYILWRLNTLLKMRK